MQIIDIHCHVLPAIDDGAQNMQMSEQMLRMAYQQGVSAVIATPHSSGRRLRSTEMIRSLCKQTEREISLRIGREFHIYPGQEIFYRDSMFRELEEGKILTLADSRYVLVEFLPDTPYSLIYHAARRFAVSGYRMVLAHAERYGCLRKRRNMEELAEIGVYYQINVQSITGRWYNGTTRWCRKVLNFQQIHFIASDMHNTDSRRPRFFSAERWMKQHLDGEYLEDISWRNALRLINNQKI